MGDKQAETTRKEKAAERVLTWYGILAFIGLAYGFWTLSGWAFWSLMLLYPPIGYSIVSTIFNHAYAGERGMGLVIGHFTVMYSIGPWIGALMLDGGIYVFSLFFQFKSPFG